MSKDLTQKLNGSLEDKVDRLIASVQSMDSRVQFISARVESIGSRVESIVESIDSRLGNVETRLGSLKTRLESFETKVDKRLKDTTPMWEAVQTQLTEVESSLRGEMERGFRRLDRVFDTYAGELGRLRGDYRGLEEQVNKIEKRLNQ